MLAWDLAAIGFLAVVAFFLLWELWLSIGNMFLLDPEDHTGLGYLMAGFVAALLLVPPLVASAWFATRWFVEWRSEPADEQHRQFLYALKVGGVIWALAALLAAIWAWFFL